MIGEASQAFALHHYCCLYTWCLYWDKGPRQTGDFHKQYCDKKIKQYHTKNIDVKMSFYLIIAMSFIVWIGNLNSWLFQLILKSNSNILTKKYWVIKILQYFFTLRYEKTKLFFTFKLPFATYQYAIPFASRACGEWQFKCEK